MTNSNPTLTTEQTTAISQIPTLLADSESVLVEARAGSGKTFLLTQVAPHLPSGICIAFNKAIALELSTKLPSHIPAKTFHALGLSILRERIPSIRTNTRKLSELAKKSSLGLPKYPKAHINLIDAMKTAGLGLPNLPALTPENAITLIQQKSLELPPSYSEERLALESIKLMKKSLADFKTVDFSDMLYLPLFLKTKFKWKFDQYPFIMIDEAQDVSPLRLELTRALTSTILAVGDPYQAIYGFAGAMSSALTTIAEAFEPHTFPLTTSFRCPTTITRHATDLIAPAAITSLESNSGGSVSRAPFDPSWYPTAPSQAVLCRTNQPLFVLALRMLREGQPLDFRSDFPSQLISFLKRFKARTITELQTRLSAWLDDQLTRLPERAKALRAMAQDKHDTLFFLSTQCEDPLTIENLLNSLLQPTEGAPVLSTIHKSKGLEWPHVHLLRSDLLPAPWTESPEDLEQERNLEYVAVTRAIETFTYFDHDRAKK